MLCLFLNRFWLLRLADMHEFLEIVLAGELALVSLSALAGS